jgi:hypothetical protein
MKRIEDQAVRRRSFWTPTRFEGGMFLFVVLVWALASIVVIRHEQAGWLLSVVYLLLAMIGAGVSWLLLWPVLRIVMHATEEK